MYRRSLKAIHLFVLVTFSLGMVTSASAAPPNTAALKKAINKTLADKDVASSSVGIFAIDVETGDVLASENADALFNPASNTKLITAAAALDLLGPSHTIFTRLSVDEVGKDGVVKGPLYIKGDGDPHILYEDVMRWALDLKRQGIASIEGGVVVDDSTFAPGFIPPAFDQKKEDAAYRAPIGAVSVNFNHVVVRVEPTKDGKPAVVSLYPPNSHVEVVNKARTRLGKSRRIRVKSITTESGTRIHVSGTIGTGIEQLSSRKRIDNPSLFAGSVVAQALVDLGIPVTGEVRVGTRPDKTRSVYLHESEPLLYHLLLMNKWSNNFMAEQIFRVLGHGANDEAATSARTYERITAFMAKAGVKGTFKAYNGSGLYDGNQYSPRQIVQVLSFMHEHRYAPDFAATLAIGGTDGTLRKRLASTDGTLRGKTGTLNQVTALAGYLKTRGGRTVAYAIFFNDTPVGAWNLRPEQDKIAQALVDFEG